VRAEALRAVIGTKLYTFCGFVGDAGPLARSDVYDTATNSWSPVADMPRRLTHAGVAVVGTDVCFAGGYIGTGNGFAQQFGTTEVWKYDSTTDTYSQMPDLPQARGGGALVAVGRELHFIGGNNSSRQDVADHYVLDLDHPDAGWSTRASMPGTGRSHMGYVNLDDKIYLVGGQTGNDEALTTTDTGFVYDPATDAWTPIASMPKAVSHISSSTFVMGGRIIVAGGETAHNVPSSAVFAYDPASNQWTSLTSLPAPRFSGVAGTIDGLIYFTGGSNLTTTYLGTPSQS
jgi:N-acetylneuraminic acid mutarotase